MRGSPHRPVAAAPLLSVVIALAVAALAACGRGAVATTAAAPSAASHDTQAVRDASADPVLPHHFVPEEVTTTGSVTVGGRRIAYHATAGTLVVHAKGWDDVTERVAIAHEKADKPDKPDDGEPSPKMTKAEASIFYVAYFKDGTASESRPIMFLYNGGPGSATVWLHMGAFGPKRVLMTGDEHLPAAPYSLVDNEWSLLDATDVVFIDAPGAGFSRIAGPDKEKSFYGIDADAYAFADFIQQFLGKYGRWNSPKYLFGESYGTTRTAVLIADLELGRSIDFNGVILLSQWLNAGLDADNADVNPGQDLPYEVALPTYAATAWYHHRLGPDVPSDLPALVAEVEHFAMTDYPLALQQGAALPEADRAAIAAKLHRYTGLPIAYIRKARLRVSGNEFAKALDDSGDATTGRLDTRFSGPALDPLAKTADYDPFSAAVGSAYVSAFNDYVRKDLRFGQDRAFHLYAEIKQWNWEHDGFGGHAVTGGMNVMGDLAAAMKFNPKLHVQLESGYFDLATPFYEGTYELAHLPIPDALRTNLETRRYESGHMVYAVPSQLRALHDNVADFIQRTSGPRTH